MGKIYCVMGKSSSGKDTVYKKLKEQYKEFRLIVPYTTRPIREGEKDGVEYYFVDPEQFRAMKEDGKVIESRSYNTKCGIWTYFTADDGQIDLSAADYLLIGTLVSYQALREYFGEEVIVPVYLEVEDGLRLARALERERRQEKPKYAEMCRRFLADEEDFSEENLIKSGITERFGNEDFTECLNKIQRYIEEIR
uniref:guanylate kinase n=1 Tax=[Ruminococcus] torques TaxID=33039 RepID=UPI00402A8981